MDGVIGRIHSVETFGAVDGPGIRYVLFLQGCMLRCLYCHNPDTWDLSSGNEISSIEVIEDIENYLSFIKNGGLTVSGGEPLLQPAFTLDLIRGAKEIGLHTAVDTAGSVPLSSTKEIADEADLILLDIKTADSSRVRELIGHSNNSAIELLKYREEINKPVWIRQVVVPGFTLYDEQFEMLANLIAPYKCIQRVELLPFHKLGEFKWQNLGFNYKLADTEPPSEYEMEHAANILRNHKLNIFIR